MSTETETTVESEFLDTAQLANMLGCTTTALRRRIYRGLIPEACIIQRTKGAKLQFRRHRVKKLLLAATGRGL